MLFCGAHLEAVPIEPVCVVSLLQQHSERASTLATGGPEPACIGTSGAICGFHLEPVPHQQRQADTLQTQEGPSTNNDEWWGTHKLGTLYMKAVVCHSLLLCQLFNYSNE